jgi:hypothetical protein
MHLLAGISSQGLADFPKSLASIFDRAGRNIEGYRPFYQHSHRTPVNRLLYVVVTVFFLTQQGNKQVTFLAPSRVTTTRGDANISRPENLAGGEYFA